VDGGHARHAHEERCKEGKRAQELSGRGSDRQEMERRMNMSRGWDSPGQSVEYSRRGPRCLLESFVFVVVSKIIISVCFPILTIISCNEIVELNEFSLLQLIEGRDS